MILMATLRSSTNEGFPLKFVEKESKVYRRVAVTDPEGNTFQFTELTSEDSQA